MDLIVSFAVGIEAIVLLALIILVFGHAVWFKQHTRKAGPIITRARSIIMAALDNSPPTADDLAFLVSMKRGIKIRLFSDMALIVGGDDRVLLRALAHETGIIEESEKLCKSRFWSKRLFGVRLLTMLNSGDTIIPSLLGDKSPYVRRQAIEWSGDHHSPDVIQSVLGMLCDPDYSCRFAAKDALIRMNVDAVAYVAEYIYSGEKCGIEGSLQVAANIADHRMLKSGIKYCGSESPTIRKLATSLLGEIGGSDASKVVGQMLLDADPIVRAEAAFVTGKLGDWTAVESLSKLLEDEDWTVRRNACIALAALGAPGLLILRHNLTHDNEEIVELAEQTLALHKFSVQSAHGIS